MGIAVVRECGSRGSARITTLSRKGGTPGPWWARFMTRLWECVGYEWGRMIMGMDKGREFWLRLGVIVGALILMSSAVAAFFD